MVQLTRIYTRGGDKGKTSLGDMSRIKKSDERIEAIGQVDEVNSMIGMVRLHTQSPDLEKADHMLYAIQNDLFDIGADLCMPEDPSDYTPLRVTQHQIDRLESEIDDLNAELSPLNSFVLPGGTHVAATLHVARTVARRAERAVQRMMDKASPVNHLVLMYLNRLSDHLFVMARYYNNKGTGDVLWIPGANRSQDPS